MNGCTGGSCSACRSAEPDPDSLPPGMLRRYDLNQSTADGVLVWVEIEDTPDGPRPADASVEVLGAARSMNDGRLFAVVFGGTDLKGMYPEIFGYGVDSLYHIRDDRLLSYRPEAYARCLAEVAERVSPAAILIGATMRGREVAPRLASMLSAGLTADCTALSMDGRDLVMTRPAFSGTLLADIVCDRYPQMATVRPGAFPKPPASEAEGTAIYWRYTGDVPDDALWEKRTEPGGGDIRDAEVLISLGNGVSRRAVDAAFRVAEALGADVSCSRPLVEKGWMPRERQVGMSGRAVSPRVYIAFGISGAVQHRAGMEGAGKVIAVNNDPHAPIHAFSDLSIISDASEVLLRMEESLLGE